MGEARDLKEKVRAREVAASSQREEARSRWLSTDAPQPVAPPELPKLPPPPEPSIFQVSVLYFPNLCCEAVHFKTSRDLKSALTQLNS